MVLLTKEEASEKIFQEEREVRDSDKTEIYKTEDQEETEIITVTTGPSNEEISRKAEFHEPHVNHLKITIKLKLSRRKFALWEWWVYILIFRMRICTSFSQLRVLCKNVSLSKTISDEAWLLLLLSIIMPLQQKVLLQTWINTRWWTVFWLLSHTRTTEDDTF